MDLCESDSDIGEIPAMCVSIVSPNGKGDICYSIHDFMCLNKNERLNDDTVEFFMSKIAEEFNVLCLSPRLYTRLVTRTAAGGGPVIDVAGPLPHIQFANVRNWNSNVFQNNLVFIPILKGQHWLLVVVCCPWAAPESNGCLFGRKRVNCDSHGLVVTKILVFDSMSGLKRVDEEMIAVVRAYLTMQWRMERNDDAADLSGVQWIKMRTPQQKNQNDCDLFVIRMAYEVAKCPPDRSMMSLTFRETRMRMKYVRAFCRKDMDGYRKLLKNVVKLCSLEQGRWCDVWNKLLK